MSENPPIYEEPHPSYVDFRCKDTNNFRYMQINYVLSCTNML